MNYTVVINCAVWFGALGYYYVNARKWFTGPKVTLDLDGLTEEQAEAIRDERLEIKGMDGARAGEGKAGIEGGEKGGFVVS